MARFFNFHQEQQMTRKALLLLIIFFSASFLSIQATAVYAAGDKATLVVWPHEKSDLPQDPAIIYRRLPNGFRYVLMQNHEPRDRVSLHLNVQAGSMHEADDEQGIAHFLEHMLFNGSTDFKPGELIKYFQSIGMMFGADANARTRFYETVYDVLLPDGNKENLEKGILVLQDYAEGALLLQAEIDRERKVVLAEKRTRDSASYRTFESTFKFELPEARISRRLPIGLENILKTADRSRFKAFYDAWYRPDNMVLVMVGDFDPDLADQLVKEKFSHMSARAPERPVPSFGKINHKGVKSFFHYEQEAGSTTVSIEMVRKIVAEPDSFDFQHRMLVKDLGDQIVQNRLDALVQQPDTPFTKASINSGIYLHVMDWAEITATCSPENWGETIAVLEQTLRSALQYGFSESELERVKKENLSFLDKAVKSAATRKSQRLARKIIQGINSDRVFQAPGQEQEIYAPVIKSLTAEQVYDAFQKTWKPEMRLILVTGNAKIPVEPERQILKVYNDSLAVNMAKSKEKEILAFPYLPPPEIQEQKLAKKEIAQLGVVCIDFPNGVRLNLKQTDFKANQILFTLGFGLGRLGEPADKAGLSSLSGAVINGSGLGRLDKEALNHALAGKNTHVSFGVNQGRFELTGRSVTEEVPLLFQLLYTYLNDMGYREDAYLLTIERFEQRYQVLAHSVDGAMELEGKRFLSGGDSRFGLPSPDRFKKNKLDDVRSWVGNSLKNDRLEMSIVGDFDPDVVQRMAGVYLGSLPAGRTDPILADSRMPVFPAAQSLEIKVPTKINKGLIQVVFPTEDFWDIHRTRRLAVLGEVFSEKLRVTIREKLGAAYSTYAYNDASRVYKDYGLFRVVVQIDPAEADTVLKEIEKITSDIIENGVSDDEFQRALDPVLTRLKDIRRTNKYWLNSVLVGSRKYPQQFDWSRTILTDYAAITAKDVTELARKYLDYSKASTIIIRPDADAM